MGITMSSFLPGASNAPTATASNTPPVTVVDAQRGHYKVHEKLWQVGSKYKILEYLGSGAYGDVCKAQVNETLEFVAIKRVKNLMQSSSTLKRILREVCIMRRLSHPNILSLKDTFMSMPNKNKGHIDLYIVSEFADKGSLFNLEGPLSIQDVKNLMRQILEGINYMHSCNVWHRDIKSGNILLISPITVKICDFNLSRSVEEIYEDQENDNGKQRSVPTQRRYTERVTTRNYRAPEIIMSHGEYGSAIDIWALGCVFWQLLKKCVPGGPPKKYIFNQQLEKYQTPQENDKFLTDTDQIRFEMLNEIFSVIGTACWKDIQSVPSRKWRQYLKNIPGRVGNLGNTLGKVDDEALDLLSRMLQFDPSNRCTAEEALNHQYFTSLGLKKIKKLTPPITLHDNKHPALALQQLEEEIERSKNNGSGMSTLMDILRKEIDKNEKENKNVQSKKRKINQLGYQNGDEETETMSKQSKESYFSMPKAFKRMN